MGPLRAAAVVAVATCLAAAATPPGAAGPPAPALAAVWANDGGDKVAREEVRASGPGASAASVRNRVWDGTTIRIFGASNETVSFNVVLEAPLASARDVRVAFDTLTGPGGALIASRPTSGDGVFDWTGRPIEVFFVRYLRIRGLSRLTWEPYDERHTPRRFRRPWSGEGAADPGTGWADRPDHDRSYPDVAVPIELEGAFDVPAGHSQSVWVDVYVPKGVPPGRYAGAVTVHEAGASPRAVPVELTVADFALPDTPAAPTMLFLGEADVAGRYLGERYPTPGTPSGDAERAIVDRHFQLAHRHRISLVGDVNTDWAHDRPGPGWAERLDGTLFTAAHGYDGPGAGTGNGVYSVGTYASWPWQAEGEAAMRAHTDAWATWFEAHAPAAERFLYLVDEPPPSEYPTLEQWASWVRTNPGPGRRLRTLATVDLTAARTELPSLDLPATTLKVGDTDTYEAAAADYMGRPGGYFLYNGARPASGTFATEDDGVALRQVAWAQYKKGAARWFGWQSTYYLDYQSGRGETDVFNTAQTFGTNDGPDPVRGEAGWNYTNGDGVLFYPGADTAYPSSSYGVNGPLASLRLKHWRRGIQDVDYLALAAAKDPAAVAGIVDGLVPRVLWEYGVDDPADPTYKRTDVSWPSDPDAWEDARWRLAAVISPGSPPVPGDPGGRPPVANPPGGGVPAPSPGAPQWAPGPPRRCRRLPRGRNKARPRCRRRPPPRRRGRRPGRLRRRRR